MSTAPVAAIDCGTNSIRLLIARPNAANGLDDVERRMEIVRLGHGVDRTGELNPAAVARTLDATRRYAQLIRASGAQRIRFVATSATRDARNREEFVGGVREILGVEPEVIDGEEEAELSFRGAVATIPGLPEGPRLVVDIGGGSTELVLGREHAEHRISVDMGSVRLTERHLQGDPPTPEQIDAAARDTEDLLDRAAATIPFSQVGAVIGVAGTVTTLTALELGLTEYTPERTHAARLQMDRTLALCEQVLRSSRQERAAQPAIHPGRVDVIGAGALIWGCVLERVRSATGITESWTSEHDILDGIAHGLIER